MVTLTLGMAVFHLGMWAACNRALDSHATMSPQNRLGALNSLSTLAESKHGQSPSDTQSVPYIPPQLAPVQVAGPLSAYVTLPESTPREEQERKELAYSLKVFHFLVRSQKIWNILSFFCWSLGFVAVLSVGREAVTTSLTRFCGGLICS